MRNYTVPDSIEDSTNQLGWGDDAGRRGHVRATHPSAAESAWTPDRAAPPRWLGPEEREAWLGLLRVLAKLPPLLDAQLERSAGLTLFEYTVLAMLSEQSDRALRMSRLATLTNASPSRLSHAARHLEARGLLVREAGSRRRAVHPGGADPGGISPSWRRRRPAMSRRSGSCSSMPSVPGSCAACGRRNERILRRIDPGRGDEAPVAARSVAGRTVARARRIDPTRPTRPTLGGVRT